MFKANQQHLQPPLISSVSDLPDKLRLRLEASWAGVFYRECFSRLKEEAFSVLYCDLPSRPNVPVNVLVGLETLKSGYGWSDEELYDAFCYNLQVRFALGIHKLGECGFELRTLYNFRQRLSAYNQEHGINLLNQAFEDITDQQAVAFKVSTGMQRMDSTQVASNILDASRLQLLVEAVQRLHRALGQADQDRLAELFAPYVQASSGQFIYRVKSKEANQAQLAILGPVIGRLLFELESSYGQELAYQVLERFFQSNFRLEEGMALPRAKEELSASSLQSPDDLEASFRRKGSKGYKGYVANLSETCEPTNPVQLITKVQVAPNNTDDAQLLVEALANLKERTGVTTIYADGGYGGPTADEELIRQEVELVQTGLRGSSPAKDKFSLADFAIEHDDQGKPLTISCPQGEVVPVELASKTTGYWAHFCPERCLDCPYYHEGRCRAKPGKRDLRFSLSFTQREVNGARRRRRHREQRKELKNLRVAVEATMRVLKLPFPAGKLPVRGRFRVTCLLVGSAAMANIRRLQRYLSRPIGQGSGPDCQGAGQMLVNTLTQPGFGFRLAGAIARVLVSGARRQPSFSC
jgi:hypothetical protein